MFDLVLWLRKTVPFFGVNQVTFTLHGPCGNECVSGICHLIASPQGEREIRERIDPVSRKSEES